MVGLKDRSLMFPRGLSEGLEVVNLFVMKEESDDGHDQGSPS